MTAKTRSGRPEGSERGMEHGARSRRTDEGGQRKKPGARVVGGKVAEDLFQRGLCLPPGTAMTEGIRREVEWMRGKNG